MRETIKINDRDHDLTIEPSNVTFEAVVNHLKQGIAHPIWVCLEPGDSTRYEFMLLHQRHITNSEYGRGIPTWGPERWLLAVRFVGGYAVGSACVMFGCGPYDFEEFSKNNHHTMVVMRWWFSHLFNALQ